MARFASTQNSEGEAIGTLADAIVADTALSYASVTANDPTLTAAQFVNGIVKLSTQTSAQDVTTPTASAIVALLPNCQVGSSFELTIINANTSSGAATIVAGSGVTLVGDVDVPISFSQMYKGRVTNVGTPAVSLYGLLSAAQLADAT